jgi:hypothetical protein
VNPTRRSFRHEPVHGLRQQQKQQRQTQDTEGGIDEQAGLLIVIAFSLLSLFWQ